MKSPLSIIFLLVLLAAWVAYSLIKKSYGNSAEKYNWNLELSKPLDYDLSIKNISYHRAGEEIYRNTSMNTLQGWSGAAAGRVLHNKPNDFLPDTVKLAWEETDTQTHYSLNFLFPKQKIIDYWNKNYDILQETWGKDYPKGQLSLRLGIAPEGLVVLWMSDLDRNTSNFAMEIASYKASPGQATTNQLADPKPTERLQEFRFGTPHFYPPETENIVAIDILYHNGEVNTRNLKKENNSILEMINTKRGWALAKQIRLHGFDEKGKGYKAIYELDLADLPSDIKTEARSHAPIIYLLDRPNDLQAEWHTFEDAYIFELTEVNRELLGK